MGKRKRDATCDGGAVVSSGLNNGARLQKKTTFGNSSDPDPSLTLQIVTGSYEKVLHGITAKVPSGPFGKDDESRERVVEFADTFLFSAHSSAIRCLAISPPTAANDAGDPHKVILASGSTDERINLYHLSTAPPPPRRKQETNLPTLAGSVVSENPKNRELGSLLHHASSITALYFPTRSKLLSSSEDNTVAITRTRDWTMLSTIKAPIPKVQGRPSGDTAPPGGIPAGVNDFAVHPSMKLMISVGKGERCMRLWNLVTGKKAGVLSFTKDILQGVGVGKWGSGEGRKVAWNESGSEFVVGFERGAVTFGMNSKPKSRVLPSPLTKLHQLCYLSVERPERAGDEPEASILTDILAVSTEDGRIIFYSTAGEPQQDQETDTASIPSGRVLGQLGGKSADLSRRIKDFEIIRPPKTDDSKGAIHSSLLVVTASSDGAIRIWTIDAEELLQNCRGSSQEDSHQGRESSKHETPLNPQSKQIGRLLGTYETGNRITCLKAFVMAAPPTSIDGPPGTKSSDGEDSEKDDTEDSE
ncbi:MAG: p21-activated protein kinase-interacting protein 1-like protein [Sclerophora amabilis]|nr:MAG: p21-activated protein kinase-interacting protein 1-like protein [Sclerophora amabilis]